MAEDWPDFSPGLGHDRRTVQAWMAPVEGPQKSAQEIQLGDSIAAQRFCQYVNYIEFFIEHVQEIPPHRVPWRPIFRQIFAKNAPRDRISERSRELPHSRSCACRNRFRVEHL